MPPHNFPIRFHLLLIRRIQNSEYLCALKLPLLKRFFLLRVPLNSIEKEKEKKLAKVAFGGV